MSRRSVLKEGRATKQITTLALAAPIVVAQRMSRMAVPGAASSAAGQRESHRMVSEKIAATTEAAIGVTAAVMRGNMNLATLLMRSCLMPGGSPSRHATAFANLMRSTVADVSNSAVAPALRKVKANARRLSR